MAIVNKSDLTGHIAEITGGTKADAQMHMDALITAIMNNIRSGNEVRITGFAAFKVQHRAARTGRNPRTGEELQIPASKTCTIKSGSALKEAAADSDE